METTINSRYLRYGGARKPLSEMTIEEIAQASDDIMRRVKEKAFYHGGYVAFVKNGVRVREYANGKIEIIENEKSGGL